MQIIIMMKIVTFPTMPMIHKTIVRMFKNDKIISQKWYIIILDIKGNQ